MTPTDASDPRPFRFTVRGLLWFTTYVAMASTVLTYPALWIAMHVILFLGLVAFYVLLVILVIQAFYKMLKFLLWPQD